MTPRREPWGGGVGVPGPAWAPSPRLGASRPREVTALSFRRLRLKAPRSSLSPLVLTARTRSVREARQRSPVLTHFSPRRLCPPVRASSACPSVPASRRWPPRVPLLRPRPAVRSPHGSQGGFEHAGGLAEEVDDKVLHAAFIPFGDITDIQIPLDYETEKHRGFAFVEFELAEDAAAAIDNMNESELFGRTIRVNLAKPMRIKEGSSRPVWSDDDWLKKFSGKTLEENKEE
ncbi:hypothetical protein PANDA_022213 [Ailuropoda melanoleuca]|uniref:RRM domain-containing protein n=1 Tax=Ailuropoda melanoleuca TaxID=9646 RepID=D2I852_AILME|nr:hypothetical protein PANDA_022213 [Ailuropoda melanoleuca]